MRTLRDGVYGLAVGDALGLPYEFLERHSFEAIDMVGYGSYNQPEGTWSDDTSLTLATCDSIREFGAVNLEDIMNKFLMWLRDSKYTPYGETFGVGNTTFKAIKSFEKNRLVPTCGQKGEKDNGNGSLMRILPLAFIKSSEEDIKNVSSLTHGHPISIEACQIYIKIAKGILLGKSLESILDNIEVSELYRNLKFLSRLNEGDIKSTAYVVTSLEAALWCVLKTNSYRSCVLKAVNLGNDTDTIGAIAGGLAGLIYGYENIPKNWIIKLKRKDLIEDCLFSG